VGVLWLGDWIGKLNEHVILSFLLEHIKEKSTVLSAIQWAMNHPVLFLWVLLALYCFAVLFTAKHSAHHDSQHAQSPLQAISDSVVTGDVRMVGSVGRDYIEAQTHIHHDPLVEARMAEFGAIDDFIVKKSEIELRETFDFPDILKFNLKFARNFHWPKDASPEDVEEINTFFKGGNGVMHLDAARQQRVGDDLQITSVPGKVYVTNLSKKFADSRNTLKVMFSSSTLPTSVADALRDLDRTLDIDVKMIATAINESFASNQRNIREHDNTSSDRHGRAWNLYWTKFSHLKPKADAISSAIRLYLDEQRPIRVNLGGGLSDGR